MNIIYLHGLSSSGNSNTARKLRELLPDDNVITPDLPVYPDETLALLGELRHTYKPDDTIVIGTSMGAMYAQQMTYYKRILVNPAFHVSELLRENEGRTLPFFSERKDGAKEFQVTTELCEAFEDMEANQFNGADGEMDIIALFGNKDDVVNCKSEYLEYYTLYHIFAGGHRMTDEIIEKTLIPVIDWMRNPLLKSDEAFPFEAVENGDMGENMQGVPFKIYRKGIGHLWFEQISKEYAGFEFMDGRKASFVFPALPEGVDKETAPLVFGNLYLRCPTVEYYGPDGIQVFSHGDSFIYKGVLIKQAR